MSISTGRSRAASYSTGRERLAAAALEVLAKRVEPAVPLLAGLGEPVPCLPAGALRLDEAGLAEGRQVLGDRLARDRQLAGELGGRRRAVVGDVAEHVPPA